MAKKPQGYQPLPLFTCSIENYTVSKNGDNNRHIYEIWTENLVNNSKSKVEVELNANDKFMTLDGKKVPPKPSMINYDRNLCFYCGKGFPHDKTKGCPAKEKKCYQCNEKGHFEKCCEVVKEINANKMEREAEREAEFKLKIAKRIVDKFSREELNEAKRRMDIETKNEALKKFNC